MKRPSVLWLDGTIKINGTDAATLESSDGPVEIEMGVEQAAASGSRGVDTHLDVTKAEFKITVTGTFFDMQILSELLGFTPATGTLDDGMTASKNFSLNSNASSLIRPYIELLVQGNKHGTENPGNANAPYRVEVWAARAQVEGAVTLPMSKSDHTKVKLTFKLLANVDASENWFEIRDEEQES